MQHLNLSGATASAGSPCRPGGRENFSIRITPVLLAGVSRENAIRELIPSRSSIAQALYFFGALFLVALGGFA
jgi:hypothetical protein